MTKTSALATINAVIFTQGETSHAAYRLARLPDPATKEDPHMADTGGAQRHPADTEQLMEYWAHGKGAAKINWGAPGDFDRCRAQLGKYVSPGIVAGLCANLHHRALGIWPGREHDKNDNKS